MKPAPAADPCWLDAAYRTRLLHTLIALYRLKTKDICALTGMTNTYVRQCRSGKTHVIHAAALRALMYDLIERDNAR